MNDFAQLVEQARLYTLQWLPADVALSVVPTALVMLVLGIGVAVLGAKLARFTITSVFILAGAGAGFLFSHAYQFPPTICTLTAALFVGLIGHLAFRFWVGLGLSVVLAGLVVGGFSYARLSPHVSAFEQQGLKVSDGTETLPLAGESKAEATMSPQQWWPKFIAFVQQRDADAERVGSALAALALMTGLLIGLVAARLALIVSTSALGTFLVLGGSGALCAHFGSVDYRLGSRYPVVVGIALGAFFATSLFLQTWMTRRPKKEASDKEDSDS